MTQQNSVNAAVNWQMLIIVSGVAVTATLGAIWLGAVAKQVDINTSRLSRVEILIDEIRQHDANTNATHNAFEQRLRRLESKSP